GMDGPEVTAAEVLVRRQTTMRCTALGLSAFGSGVALLLSLSTVLTAQTAAEWEAAAHQIVRLAPSAFPELPVAVREELERRGCRIPQLGSAFRTPPANVVSGPLAR